MIKGLVLSVIASSLFAAQYYLSTLIVGMSGIAIFGWRTIISVPFMTFFFILSGRRREIAIIFFRVLKKPSLVLGLLLCSALMTLQQWLFIWAPLNGKGLDVSLGYFMLPLVMLLVSRFVYGEQLSRLKLIAASTAAIGVINELYHVGGFSWATLTVSFGITLYFIIRNKLRFNTLGGLWFDMILMLPFAVWAVMQNDPHGSIGPNSFRTGMLISVLGIESAMAFIAYISASSMLSFSLFGLMGYVEPILLVLVALLIGEKIENKEIFTYVFIWLAVLFLIGDGIKEMISRKKVLTHRIHVSGEETRIQRD